MMSNFWWKIQKVRSIIIMIYQYKICFNVTRKIICIYLLRNWFIAHQYKAQNITFTKIFRCSIFCKRCIEVFDIYESIMIDLHLFLSAYQEIAKHFWRWIDFLYIIYYVYKGSSINDDVKNNESQNIFEQFYYVI